MSYADYLRTRKIGFIGLGNLAQAMIRGWIASGVVLPNRIWASNRSEKKLERITSELGINPAGSNEEVVDQCNVVIFATKPGDLIAAIEPLAMSFETTHQVMSLAAGIQLKELERILPKVENLVRVMCNTPIRLRSAVIGYCLSKRAKDNETWFTDLLSPLGELFATQEDESMEALTVATSSGVGFIFELMNYWIEWLTDYGIDEEMARRMTVRTFAGASQMALQLVNYPMEELINQVASKKGITWSGLESMRELEIERTLRVSFEKAILREKELRGK